MSRLKNLSSRQKTALALIGLGILFLFPLRGLLRAQGPPMEEGFMLVFPERVLHGDLPNQDFLHLYGPGSLWVLAGVYKVFGVQLLNERLFGLAQQISIVLGMFGLARFWGRTVAFFCGVIALIIILPPIGLTALAWVGGVGLGPPRLLATLVGPATTRAPDTTRAASAGRWSVASSPVRRCCSGSTSSWRSGSRRWPRCWGTDKRFKIRFGAGLALGVVGYLVHLAMAGPYTVFKGMVLDPVVYLRGGRRLPVPPPWDHLDGFLQRSGNYMPNHWPIPALTTSAQLTVWFFLLLASVAFLLVVGIQAVRKDRSSLPGPGPARRRAVQRRHGPPGHAAGRLRALRVGELRAVRVRTRRGAPAAGAPARRRGPTGARRFSVAAARSS